MENDQQLTYHQFLRMQINADIKKSTEKQPELVEVAEKVKMKEPEEKKTKIEKISFMTNLCRVCSSPGTISVHSIPPEILLSFKPSPESKKNKKTIAKMIQEVSGCEVNFKKDPVVKGINIFNDFLFLD